MSLQHTDDEDNVFAPSGDAFEADPIEGGLSKNDRVAFTAISSVDFKHESTDEAVFFHTMTELATNAASQTMFGKNKDWLIDQSKALLLRAQYVGSRVNGKWAPIVQKLVTFYMKLKISTSSEMSPILSVFVTKLNEDNSPINDATVKALETDKNKAMLEERAKKSFLGKLKDRAGQAVSKSKKLSDKPYFKDVVALFAGIDDQKLRKQVYFLMMVGVYMYEQNPKAAYEMCDQKE